MISYNFVVSFRVCNLHALLILRVVTQWWHAVGSEQRIKFKVKHISNGKQEILMENTRKIEHKV